MAEYSVNKPHFIYQLIDALVREGGGTAVDYTVENGGFTVEAGVITPRPNYLRVSTSQITQQQLETIVDGHNAVVLVVTASQIEADGSEPTTITIQGGGSFQYVIYTYYMANGKKGTTQRLKNGNAPDGSLTLRTDEGGLYLIEVINGVQTGYAEVEAIST